MRKKSKYNLIKILISAFIFLTLLLPPPGLLTARASAVGPQETSKDALRLKNYLTQINSYLKEAKDIVGAATGDGAKEYLTNSIWPILSPDCPAFLQKEKDELSDRIVASSHKEQTAYDTYIAAGVAGGELATDINGSWVLAYTKAGESPYPLGDRSGQKASTAYAQALKTYDNEVTGYLIQYLYILESRISTELSWNSPAKAPEELLRRAKEAVAYVYEINRELKKIAYDITLAQKNYQRENEQYGIYVDYYNQLYNAYTANAKEYSFYYPDRLSWVSVSQAFQRIGWNYAIATTQLFWHSFDPNSKVWISRESPFYPNPNTRTVFIGQPLEAAGTSSLPALGPVRLAKTDLNEIKAILRAKIGPTNEAELLILIDKGARIYAAANQLFDAFKSIEQELVTALNANLEKYKADFPYTKPYALKEEDKVNSLGIHYTLTSISDCEYPTTPNQPPTALPKADATEKKIPEAFKLDASESTDPEKDPLTYEWIITQIPETSEAKATSVVLYQRFSGEKIDFKLDPRNDPVGDWVIKLIVSDGKKSAEKEITLKATRHILWIEHSDKDITLELYQGFDNPPPLVKTQAPPEFFHTGSYLLEAARDQVGMFLNYNDAGKPVDIDSGYRPKTDYIYKVYRGYGAAYPKGAYDGCYGSTDMVDAQGGKNPNIFRKDLSPLELKSASAKSGNVCLYIEVADPQVCELVLSNKNSPFGLRFRQKGGYYIQQWVDNASWVNDHGRGPEGSGKEGFRQLPRPNGVPDWLERYSGEFVLNEFAGYLPDVERILVYKGDKKGGYFNGERAIYINPNYFDIRYNSRSISRYGFLVTQGLQGITLFLADKSHYYWSVLSPLNKKIPDNDRDLLPLGNGGTIVDMPPARDLLGRITSKFEALAASILFDLTGTSLNFFSYLADLDSNTYGPQVQTNLTYKGDSISDNKHGQEKLLQTKYNTQAKKFEENDGFLTPGGLTCMLPLNLPIDSVPKVDIFINCRRQKGKTPGPVKIHFIQNKHYRWKLNYLLTLKAKVLGINIGPLAGLNTFPVLEITFNKDVYSFVEELAISGYVMTDPNVNIIYTVYIPFAIADLNAASKTGIYTGQFNRFFTDDY